jgi:hypothetical protein
MENDDAIVAESTKKLQLTLMDALKFTPLPVGYADDTLYGAVVKEKEYEEGIGCPSTSFALVAIMTVYFVSEASMLSEARFQ